MMIVVALLVIVILTLVAVIVVGAWGATMAVTTATLAASNAANQATIDLLACALVATIPLIAFGAFRLGQVAQERNRARDDKDSTVNVSEPSQTRIASAAMRASEVELLEAGYSPHQIVPDSLPLAVPQNAPILIRTSRRIPRSPRRTQYAIRIARRWFQ